MTDKHTPTTAQPEAEESVADLRASLLASLHELEASAQQDEVRAQRLLDAAGFATDLDEAMRYGAYALQGRAAVVRKLIAQALAGGAA